VPEYQYECKNCGLKFKKFRSMDLCLRVRCPECRHKPNIVIEGANIATSDWIKGKDSKGDTWPDIFGEEVRIESKADLRRECEKRDLVPVCLQ